MWQAEQRDMKMLAPFIELPLQNALGQAAFEKSTIPFSKRKLLGNYVYLRRTPLHVW